MSWPKGKPRPPNAGRKKGTPNKSSIPAQELAEKLGIDPFEVLLNFAKGDWAALGYLKPTETKHSQFGTPFEVPLITPQMRMFAANNCIDYILPKRKAVEHTGKDGEALNAVSVNLTTSWKELPKEDDEREP